MVAGADDGSVVGLAEEMSTGLSAVLAISGARSEISSTEVGSVSPSEMTLSGKMLTVIEVEVA